MRGDVPGARQHRAGTADHTGNLKEGIRIGFQRKTPSRWSLRNALGLGG